MPRKGSTISLEEAAAYRIEHWRERWQCHPWCTAAGPFDRHDARCVSLMPADHPTRGLLLTVTWSW